MSTQNIPLLNELDTEQFRRRLAGLERAVEEPEIPPDEIRALAIAFAAELPRVFGDSLDRTTLWDRIGSGLQTAYAKTVTDHELFIAEVLEHIKAEHAKAVSCEGLVSVLATLSSWSQSSREAWMRYLATHLVVVLVHARTAWEGVKAQRKTSSEPSAAQKAKAERKQESMKSFLPDGDE